MAVSGFYLDKNLRVMPAVERATALLPDWLYHFGWSAAFIERAYTCDKCLGHPTTIE